MSATHLRLLGGVHLSVREDGRERLVPMPPKPTALLAFLAVAGADGRALRRDTLLALFWPELPEARARAALRQVLFRLRRILGGEVLRTDRESVALAPGAVCCDAVAFERELEAGSPVSALELYRGELLDGFYVDGMSRELEDWMERERERLKQLAVRAMWTVADEADRGGDPAAATDWARRAVSLESHDEVAVRRLIALLDRRGDRAGALHAADDLARRMAEAYGSGPSRETREMVAAIRARQAILDSNGPAETGGAAEVAPPGPVPGAAPGPAADVRSEPSERKAMRPGASVPEATEPGRGSPAVGGASLARRLRWWPGSPRGAVLPAAGVLAMLAVLVVGELLAPSGGPDGSSAASRRAEAASPTATIASPVARRLYEEGLGRYYAGDEREAARLLQAALTEDAACAMCAYYAFLADSRFDDTAAVRMLRAAMDLAPSVSEPERLLIRFGWADATNSPDRLAVAESLATRLPAWPEAQLAVGEALWMDGDYLGAVPHLRAVLSSRPDGTHAAGGECPVCTAEWLLVNTYKSADSMPAAVRVARGWVRVSPRSRSAWLELANALAGSDRLDEARAALDSSTAYAADEHDDPIGRAQIEIRAGNFAVADRLLQTLALTGQANSREDALWWLVISLREQGRLREALAVARGPLVAVESGSTLGGGAALVARGQVLFELGRYREAAQLFEAQARPKPGSGPAGVGNLARRRTWFLTQAGSALAAVGDTAELAALADTVRTWGLRSGLGRDRHLHEYLRGLLWLARGRPNEAVAAFRRAVVSETEGFSRLDLQLARTLVGLGRPDEAVSVLRHALSGSIEGGNYYATRTELQELLARAYDAAAEPDSAAAYYDRVARAWRSADPRLRSRAARDRAVISLSRRNLASRR